MQKAKFRNVGIKGSVYNISIFQNQCYAQSQGVLKSSKYLLGFSAKHSCAGYGLK